MPAPPLHEKEYTMTNNQEQKQIPVYLKAKEARKMLGGMSENTFMKYRDQGKIPFTFIGDYRLYPLDGLVAYLERNMNGKSHKD